MAKALRSNGPEAVAVGRAQEGPVQLRHDGLRVRVAAPVPGSAYPAGTDPRTVQLDGCVTCWRRTDPLLSFPLSFARTHSLPSLALRVARFTRSAERQACMRPCRGAKASCTTPRSSLSSRVSFLPQANSGRTGCSTGQGSMLQLVQLLIFAPTRAHAPSS